MAIRTAKIASAIFAGIVAGTPLAVFTVGAAQGAECLAEPKQETPKGQHWFYRIEHGTQRHCWYLRGESKGTAEKLTSSDSSPAPNEAAHKGPQTPASVADAHAELPWPQAPDEADGNAAATAKPAPVAANSMVAQSSAAAPADPAGGSTVASRWPDSSGAASPSAAGSPPTPADLVADAQTDADAQTSSDTAPAPGAATVAPLKTVATDATTTRGSASLQMLLLVVFGALTLAGLTASIVYRLGRARRRAQAAARRRSGALWESVDFTRADDAPQAPWVEPAVGKTAPRPNVQRASEQAGADADDGIDRIEEFIAKLTRQLQADMESPGSR